MTTAVERAFSQALPSSNMPAAGSWPALDAQMYMSSSSLTDELARRQAPGAYPPAERDHAAAYGNGWVPPIYFAEIRHDVGNDTAETPAQPQGLVSKWRQKEKLKTTAVAMVLCLNIGVDPPDVIKISPCARLECWIDPSSMQPPKALDTIGKNLQAQYERWQARAKYKMHLDPTVDDVKKLAQSSRRTARNERVLFHYNGHGVPRPTANGEIWVFNKSYTQYIPMSIYDLQSYVGTPAIYLFDCSAAGLIVNSFKVFAEQRRQESMAAVGSTPGGWGSEGPMRECILLAACGANELLPQSPELPADVFTSCLTTPIKVALRWFCNRSLLRGEGFTKELIDNIPGRQTDRRTPLGELNWIFTAITDTIAWNMLPRPLFQKLFRQDLLVASLFRNFLLAERIMRACNCTPVSWPKLPPTHQHPMWHAWDMAAEMCLLKLPALLESNQAEADFKPSPFFAEQLRAFELWLEAGCQRRRPPEQLPIVLQVLLSQVHRARALALLERFLDLGSWAVDLALSVGIFPYVLKLLQTSSPDLRNTLVFIWTKILALDRSCQVDLVKDNGAKYFVDHLATDEAPQWAPSRAQAAFVLAVIADKHPRGQQLEMELGVLHLVLQQLPAAAAAAEGAPSPDTSSAVLQAQWLAHAVAKIVEDSPMLAEQAVAFGAAQRLLPLLSANSPELRASGAFALGTLLPAPGACSPAAAGGARASVGGSAHNGTVHSGTTHSGTTDHYSDWPSAETTVSQREVVGWLSAASRDGSPLVRSEVAVALARFAATHSASFQDAVENLQRETAALLVGAVDETSQGFAPSPSQCNLRAPSTAVSGTASPLNSMLASSGGGISSTRTSFDGPLTHNPEASESVHSGRSPFHPEWSSPTAPKKVGVRIGGSEHGAILAGTALQMTSMSPPLAEPRPGPGSAPSDDRLLTRVVEETEEADTKGGSRRQSATVSAFAAASSGPLPHDDDDDDGFSEGPSLAALAAEVLHVGCLLATDPVAGVAALGTALLSQIDVEVAVASLQPARGSGGVLSTAARQVAHRDLHTAASAPMHGLPNGGFGSAGNLHRAVSRKLSSWRSSSLKPPSLAFPTAEGVAGGGAEASPKQSAPLMRSVLILRNKRGAPMGNVLKALQKAECSQRSMSCDPRTLDTAVGKPAMAPQWRTWDAVEAAAAAAQLLASMGEGGKSADSTPRPPLPTSIVYLLSCQYFSRPLLEPQASMYKAEHSQCYNPPTAAERTARLLEREDMIEGCKAMKIDDAAALSTSSPSRTSGSASSPSSASSQQVLRIETESSTTAACCFHPFKPLLTTVDSRGMVRVINYTLPPTDAARHALDARAIVNRFQLARGDSPQTAKAEVAVSALYHINEVAGGMLLAGAADGVVRVWRNFPHRGAQRLATAWRAVPVPVSGGDPCGAAVYDWCPDRDWLAAGGCASPAAAHIWNLHSEKRELQVHDKNGSDATWQHLAQPRKGPPLLFVGGADGIVSLFDLRAGGDEAAARLRLSNGPLVGMTVGPGHSSHQLLLCTATGEVQLADFRRTSSGCGSSTTIGSDSDGVESAGSSPREQNASWKLGVWKKAGGGDGEGESMTAMAAHPHAPLLATASTHSYQVLRLWGPRGEALLRRRATGGTASQARNGSISTMTWHPYRPLLAKAHADNSLAIWSVDLAAASGAPCGSSTPR